MKVIKFDPYKDHDGETYREEPCPKCGKQLMLIPPDTVWCENKECNYAETHIVGNGIIKEYAEMKNTNLFRNSQ